jgi:glutaredoxin-dependent peroxiredoxin
VFGVSVDSVYSHGAFAKELGGLPFELVADFERKMVDAWGVRRTDLDGYDGVPRRTIFILDPEMRVCWRWITSPEQRLPDTEEVLAEAMKVGEAPAKPKRKPAVRTTRKTTGKAKKA